MMLKSAEYQAAHNPSAIINLAGRVGCPQSIRVAAVVMVDCLALLGTQAPQNTSVTCMRLRMVWLPLYGDHAV